VRLPWPRPWTLAGLTAVDAIRNRTELDSYYLLYAVLGDLEVCRGNFPAAADYFRQSVELTEVESEQVFLSRRIEECEERVGVQMR